MTNKKYNKEILIELIKDFVIKNKRYPLTKDFHSYNNLPDFYYNYIPLLGNELIEVLENCGYYLNNNEKYSLMGNAKHNEIFTKEYCINNIIKMHKQLNRPLMYDDFRNPQNGNVGIKSIKKYWGTVNKMKKELGLEIIQESMIDRHFSFDDIKISLKNICDSVLLYEKRKILTYYDFYKYGCGVDMNTYRNMCIRNGTTLRSYVNFLEFDLQKPGNGYDHVFEDGERTNSIYEYNFSNLLRKNNFKYNLNYFRDVRYNTFIDNYNNLMNCDYVIPIIDNICIYIELAGMIRDYKTRYYKGLSFKSKSKNNYVEKLRLKEKLLKENNLLYYIFIPYRYKDSDEVELNNLLDKIKYAKDHTEDIINNMFDF
jgi:hypothetical protein